MFFIKDRLFIIMLQFLLISAVGCDHATISKDENQSIEENQTPQIEAPVDYLNIKFTKPVIEMAEPTDTVSIKSFSSEADHLKDWFYDLDEELIITRYMPEFDPTDTLKVNARGDTTRSSNWALVYEFHLIKYVPFYEVRDELQEEPLIEWVDPPISIEPASE